MRTDPGGKGINVSTVLSALGVENVALGFLAGFTGRALEEGLHNLGIRTDFIWLPEGLTRINVKVKGGAETEINGQGPTVGPTALRTLQDKLDRLWEDQTMLRTPIVRNGRQATVGYCPEVWAAWE